MAEPLRSNARRKQTAAPPHSCINDTTLADTTIAASDWRALQQHHRKKHDKEEPPRRDTQIRRNQRRSRRTSQIDACERRATNSPSNHRNDTAFKCREARYKEEWEARLQTDLKDASGGKSTCFINRKALLLLIKWVLLSTKILCDYTHQHAQPVMLNCTPDLPSSHLSMPPPITYPIHPRFATSKPLQRHQPTRICPHALKPRCDHYNLETAKLRHSTPPRSPPAPARKTPPSSPTPHRCPVGTNVRWAYPHYKHPLNTPAITPHTTPTPRSSRPPSTPTHHHNTHTGVSKPTCTYHTINANTKKNSIPSSTLPENLPPPLQNALPHTDKAAPNMHRIGKPLRTQAEPKDQIAQPPPPH